MGYMPDSVMTSADEIGFHRVSALWDGSQGVDEPAIPLFIVVEPRGYEKGWPVLQSQSDPVKCCAMGVVVVAQTQTRHMTDVGVNVRLDPNVPV
jgi:hypothetical protein